MATQITASEGRYIVIIALLAAIAIVFIGLFSWAQVNVNNLLSQQQSTELNTYDFIIVGMGPGGCVMASRLSEEPAFSVLALDAGAKDKEDAGFKSTEKADFTSFSSFRDLMVFSVPQKFTNNRTMYIPRFSGLGGTTRLYGGIAVRPSREMMNRWPQKWQYDDMLPYYKKMEDHFCYYQDPSETGITKEDCEKHHNKGGKMQVNSMVFEEFSPFEQAFKPFCHNTSYPWKGWNPDLNGENPLGCSFTQRFFNRSENQRGNVSAPADVETGFHYFNRGVRNRTNLQIREGHRVLKVLFDNSTNPPTAKGVLVQNATGIFKLYARNKVILSAGAIVTPHLLQVSGVGVRSELEAVGIEFVAENQHVGRNLRDHVAIPLIVAVKDRKFVTPNTTTGANSNANKSKAWVMQFGLDNPNITEMQIVFTHQNVHSPDDFLDATPRNCRQGSEGIKETPAEYTFRMILQDPSFRGTVKAATASIYDRPVVDFGWNDMPDKEIRLFERTIKIIQDILNTSRQVNDSIGSMVLDQILPDLGVSPTIKDFLQSNLETALHPVSTCQMGLCASPTNLEVYGTSGLVVCDASAFGGQVDGNPVLSILALAEKLADDLRKDPALQQIRMSSISSSQSNSLRASSREREEIRVNPPGFTTLSREDVPLVDYTGYSNN